VEIGSLPLVQAQARNRLLEQYLLACPDCGKSSVAHVGRTEAGAAFLVRFVCPDACPVQHAEILAIVIADSVELTA
jgi:hypothetical protein